MFIIRKNSGNYRKAVFACRKHRIDLNVLVENNQEEFLERISSFVEQIHEVDHVNLFLTNIGFVGDFINPMLSLFLYFISLVAGHNHRRSSYRFVMPSGWSSRT